MFIQRARQAAFAAFLGPCKIQENRVFLNLLRIH